MTKNKSRFLEVFIICFPFINIIFAETVVDGIRIDLSDRLSLDTAGGQFAQLFIPDYYKSPADSLYRFGHQLIFLTAWR